MEPVRFAPLHVPPGAAGAASATPGAEPQAGFASAMESALASANREQLGAEQAAQQLANGEVDVVDAVLAISKADLTLRHLVALRNRVLEAFQDVMRIPL
jgi:flagellar hook-basal body complex protein FliE